MHYLDHIHDNILEKSKRLVGSSVFTRERFYILVSFLAGASVWYVFRHLSFFEHALQDADLTVFISDLLITCNHWLLRTLGIESTIWNNILRIPNSQGYQLVYDCYAYSHMVLLTTLILTYPGKWTRKVWFIPAGLISIQLLNLFRLIILSLVLYYHQAFAEFTHYYATRILIYTGILFFWWLWIRHLAPLDP